MSTTLHVYGMLLNFYLSAVQWYNCLGVFDDIACLKDFVRQAVFMSNICDDVFKL